MRDPKGKKVSDLFPSLFDDDGEADDEPPLSDEDRAELQALMDAENARNRSS